MAFGKAFHTLKEANVEVKWVKEKTGRAVEVRKMKKKLFPRRKKLFHVGSHIEFLNFA